MSPDPGAPTPPPSSPPSSSAPRLAFTASVVLYAVVWVVAFVLLPERVPLHFGGSGAPDRWGGRTEALVTFAILGVAMGSLLGGVALARLPIQLVNVPHKEWWTATEERTARLRAMIRDDGLRLGAATMLLLSALLLLTVRAARLDEPRLDAAAWVVIALYLAWVLGFVWRTLRGRYQPGESGEHGEPGLP